MYSEPDLDHLLPLETCDTFDIVKINDGPVWLRFYVDVDNSVDADVE